MYYSNIIMCFLTISLLLNLDNKCNYIVTGSQKWSTTDIRAKVFNNGDTILYADSDSLWQRANLKKLPAWCYSKDGRRVLYNSYVVSDNRSICPEGYRIPTNRDWALLLNENGGPNLAPSRFLNTGRDSCSEFSIYPTDSRSVNGSYEFEGCAVFWSSTMVNSRYSYIFMAEDLTLTSQTPDGTGCAIRLIKRN